MKSLDTWSFQSTKGGGQEIGKYIKSFQSQQYWYLLCKPSDPSSISGTPIKVEGDQPHGIFLCLHIYVMAHASPHITHTHTYHTHTYIIHRHTSHTNTQYNSEYHNSKNYKLIPDMKLWCSLQMSAAAEELGMVVSVRCPTETERRGQRDRPRE